MSLIFFEYLVTCYSIAEKLLSVTFIKLVTWTEELLNTNCLITLDNIIQYWRCVIFQLIIPSMQPHYLLPFLFTLTLTLDPCQMHIAHLLQLYTLDRPQFLKEVAGYVLFSGKMVNDLGLPDSCIKNSNYRFFTAHSETAYNDAEYHNFLGVCFSSKCDTETMDQNSGAIINQILNISDVANATMTFAQPELTVSSTPAQIVLIVLFCLLIIVSLKDTVFTFFRNCRKEAHQQDQDLYGKYAVQFGQDYDPTLLVVQQNENFFKRVSLPAKMHEYCNTQQSSKIISFSAIRILAVPLALYGYLFYLCNLGSYNYSSFIDEIYETTYSKVAVAAYYLPDILFFMSGFLLSRKGFALVEVEQKPAQALWNLLKDKLLRWGMLYYSFVLIYWLISPCLHTGPLWFQYQEQVAQCSSGWWRVLLFIDNWFSNGCYNFAWFVPVEIQLSLLCVLFLMVYSQKKSVAWILLGLAALGTWILTLTLSAPFPSSLETTLNNRSESYFKSTYAHMPYYLLGVVNGFLAYNEHTRETLQKLTANKYFRIFGLLSGITIILVVVIHPSLWQNELTFELGLAKTGMFVGLYLILFWDMFGGKMNKSMIHHMATLSKGVLLIGGLIVASYYWGAYTLPYLDRGYMLTTTIANLMIAIPVGAFLLALLWQRPKKEEHIIL